MLLHMPETVLDWRPRPCNTARKRSLVSKQVHGLVAMGARRLAASSLNAFGAYRVVYSRQAAWRLHAFRCKRYAVGTDIIATVLTYLPR